MRILYACALLAVMLFVSCASQDTVDIINFDKSALFGMIYDDDNQPCAGAELKIDGRRGPITDIRGRFVLPDLSRGKHVLTARKEGYEDLTASFDFLNKTDVLYLRIVSFGQLLSKAEKALEERKWDIADAFLGRAEKIDAGDPVFLYLRAVQAYKTGRYRDTVAYLDIIIAKGAKDPYVYLFLADIYQKNLNQPAKAIEDLEIYLTKRADSDVEARLEGLRKKSGETP
jgi:tetratricopeptide (TPR) repeat protein